MHNKILTQTFIIAAMMITLASCSDSDDQAIDEDLLDVVWRVDTLFTPEEQITPGPDTLMTIQFTRDMKVGGRGGCNTYFGIYEINKKVSISFDVRSWTEKGCDGRRLLSLDGILQNALENVTAYEVDEDRLILYDSNRNYVVKLRN